MAINLNKQREFFKKIHPEQFSDSQVVKVGNLDRDYFAYFMDTLTNEGREKEFEVFSRKIAESEICPNLLPQTGPTGGGDSKVDSETYPVSDTLSETWYYGDGNIAAQERWAFAISAKKDWKPKVKSDVEKIAKVNTETGRKYTKIFFMTNQFVSDKQRAEMEDKLRKLFNIDVRILDRNWFLEKVFSGNNKHIAIQCFHLSQSFADHMEIGSKDYQRKQELEKIESALRSPTDIKELERLGMAERSVVLSRELEVPKDKMIGILDRQRRLTEKYGTKVEVAESIYDYAWTIYWWYGDKELYYKKYLEYEKITVGEWNVQQLKNLTTLWSNLYAIAHENPDLIPFDKHTEILENEHKRFIEDLTKPNSSLEAKASFQIIRTLLGHDIEDILKDYIEIINNSDGNLDFDLYSINKILMDIPIFKQSPLYSDVFELLVDKMGKRSQDLKIARMLISRGNDILDEPYEAIKFYSRAITKLFKEESKKDLIMALVQMANCFENVGLLWAARNFYFYVFCLCLNQYMKFGEVHIALAISAESLKLLELRFGRIIYATEFENLEKIFKRLYTTNINNEEKGELFDYILGMQMFRVEFGILPKLVNLPDYFGERGLIFAEAALKYELGYYDEEMLEQFQGSKEAFDDFIVKWRNQPAKEQFIGVPWFGVEDKLVLSSKVLGCTLKVITENNAITMEVASTILASLESFFITGMHNQLVPLSDSITFEVELIDSKEFKISLEKLENRKNYIKVSCSDYRQQDIITAQERMQEFLLGVLAHFTAIVFPYGSMLKGIEKMVVNENALGRSQIFSNSIFYALETLGRDIFTYDQVVTQTNAYKLLRNEKSVITREQQENEETKPLGKLEVHLGDLPPNVSFDNINQQDIHVNSIINLQYWDKAKWKGVMFLNFPYNDFPPMLSLVYRNDIAIQIFKEWISEIGTNDTEDKIKIGIIKGINKKYPYWYRVIIGTDPTNNFEVKGKKVVISNLNRLHTMEATTDENLKRFEESLKVSPVFTIFPSIMNSTSCEPSMKHDYAINKKKSSIIICNAWEIKKDDYFLYSAVMPNDDPVIPKGFENAPIIEMIKSHKHFENKNSK